MAIKAAAEAPKQKLTAEQIGPEGYQGEYPAIPTRCALNVLKGLEAFKTSRDLENGQWAFNFEHRRREFPLELDVERSAPEAMAPFVHKTLEILAKRLQEDNQKTEEQLKWLDATDRGLSGHVMVFMSMRDWNWNVNSLDFKKSIADLQAHLKPAK